MWEITSAPLLRFSEISCQRANDYALLDASLEVGGAPFLKRCAPLVGSSRRTLKRLYVRTSKKAHALTPMSKAPLVRLLPLRIRSGT